MTTLLDPWGLGSSRDRPDIPIPGSPERCLSRRVVEDEAGTLYVLETLAPTQVATRQRAAALAAALREAGLDRAWCCLPGRDGGFVDSTGATHRQLSHFVSGSPLPRPEYTRQEEPGRELGLFVADMRECASRAALPADLPDFSLSGYAADFLRTLKTTAPAVHVRVAACLADIREFLEVEPSLPRTPSHGDLHPENAVWNGTRLASVIDWEFSGARHELYDAATALGCMGIESPATFQRGAGAAMIAVLRDRGVLRADNLRWLRPAVIAGRLGWLAEWLRQKDREMIEMELDYMELLTR